MTHKADKQFAVEYSYADSDWGLVIWADNLDDAARKLRAIQANARVLGEIHAHIALPNWFGRLLIRLGLADDKP